MIWARHPGDSKFHAVAAIAGGSVVTECRGRWNVTDEYDTEDRPAVPDRCGYCESVVGSGCACRYGADCALHTEPVERGLRELEQVTR